MALVVKYEWGYDYDDSGYLDTWRDTKARASCDRAAAAVEAGNDYWGNEPIQFDNPARQSAAGRNAALASKPAGALVQDEKVEA